MTVEVFADGIGSVKVVGEIVRIDFVALGAGGSKPCARIDLPVSSLDEMIESLTRTRKSLVAATDKERAAQ